MEIFYAILFGAMAVAAAVLELGKPKESTDSSLTRDFLRFSRYALTRKTHAGDGVLNRNVVAQI